MPTSYAIETLDLRKTYGSAADPIHALRGINLAIPQGEIYAFLGPNGAGKTTTLSILTTLLIPTSGSATVAGLDVVAEAAAVRRAIGVTFQELVLDQDLSGRQILDFHGQLYGQARADRRARIHDLGELVELTSFLDRRAAAYSGGMKRRLELARGLMTQPAILFLDEPTQGLDPQNRAGIWNYIRRLRAETGITILLTTHYMEEAEYLADRVGIIDHGNLLVEGTPADLKRAMGADIVSIGGGGNEPAFARAIQGAPYVTHVSRHATEDVAHVLQVGVDDSEQRLADLVSLAAASGFHIRTVSASRPTLADVFLSYTGHALRDA